MSNKQTINVLLIIYIIFYFYNLYLNNGTNTFIAYRGLLLIDVIKILLILKVIDFVYEKIKERKERKEKIGEFLNNKLFS